MFRPSSRHFLSRDMRRHKRLIGEKLKLGVAKAHHEHTSFKAAAKAVRSAIRLTDIAALHQYGDNFADSLSPAATKGQRSFLLLLDVGSRCCVKSHDESAFVGATYRNATIVEKFNGVGECLVRYEDDRSERRVPIEMVQSPDESLVDDEMLPPGWQLVSLGSGKDSAYYNSSTKETSWEKPSWNPKDLVVQQPKGRPVKVLVMASATGFGVGFGRNPQTGKIVISRLRPGGNAAKDRQLTIGSDVLAVNGVDVGGKVPKEVTAMLKGTQQVELVVVTNPNGAQVGGGTPKGKSDKKKKKVASSEGTEKKKKKKADATSGEQTWQEREMPGRSSTRSSRRGSLVARLAKESHQDVVRTYSPQLVRKSLNAKATVLKSSNSHEDIRHAIKMEEASRHANAMALSEIQRVRKMRRAKADLTTVGRAATTPSRAAPNSKETATRVVRMGVRRQSLAGEEDDDLDPSMWNRQNEGVTRISSGTRRKSQANPQEIMAAIAAVAAMDNDPDHPTSSSTSDFSAEPTGASDGDGADGTPPPSPSRLGRRPSIQELGLTSITHSSAALTSNLPIRIPSTLENAKKHLLGVVTGESHVDEEAHIVGQADHSQGLSRSAHLLSLTGENSDHLEPLLPFRQRAFTSDTAHSGKSPGRLSSSALLDNTLPVMSEVSQNVHTVFKTFLEAQDVWDILATFEDVLIAADVVTDGGHGFYDELNRKAVPDLNYKQLHYFRCITGLMKKMRAQPEFREMTGVQCVIVGAGPVGLRAAIEFSMRGADVTLIEKRNSFPRLNILHLWDWACTDLSNLGFNRSDLFGPGGNNHIGTRKLQLTLTRMACVLGVRIYTGVEFVSVKKPTAGGWFKVVTRATDKDGFNDRCGSELEANLLLDAGGTVAPVVKHYGIKQKHTKLAQSLGLVAHFTRNRGESVEEFSWAYQYKKKEFDALNEAKGVKLENVVHYKRSTHYIVMTPTADSLVARGALKKKEKTAAALVNPKNVNKAKLKEFAKDAAVFWGLPAGSQFIEDDRQAAQLFDFSERTYTTESIHFEEAGGAQLVVGVIGDALIEPFWPEGLGINRGFLSILDMAYVIQTYFALGRVAPQDIKPMCRLKNELFRLQHTLSGHTKKEVLRDESDRAPYLINPDTRYVEYRAQTIMTAAVTGIETPQHANQLKRTSRTGSLSSSTGSLPGSPMGRDSSGGSAFGAGPAIAEDPNARVAKVPARGGRKPSNSTPVKGGCPVCGQVVYAMEKLVVEGVNYHKKCFKCKQCGNKLSTGNYASLEGELYCKPHFKQLFTLKGNYNEGFGSEQAKHKWDRGAGSTDAASPPPAERTPRVPARSSAMDETSKWAKQTPEAAPKMPKRKVGGPRPAWDCRDKDKNSALATLRGRPGGAFVIRATDKGFAAMSLVTPQLSLYQRVIIKTSNGAMSLMNSKLQFPGDDDMDMIHKLVGHYAKATNSELPCLLNGI